MNSKFQWDNPIAALRSMTNPYAICFFSIFDPSPNKVTFNPNPQKLNTNPKALVPEYANPKTHKITQNTWWQNTNGDEPKVCLLEASDE